MKAHSVKLSVALTAEMSPPPVTFHPAMYTSRLNQNQPSRAMPRMGIRAMIVVTD